MKTKFNNQMRKFLYGFMVVGMILPLCFGISGVPSARAQEADTETTSPQVIKTPAETILPTEKSIPTDTNTEISTETPAIMETATEPMATTLTPITAATDTSASFTQEAGTKTLTSMTKASPQSTSAYLSEEVAFIPNGKGAGQIQIMPGFEEQKPVGPSAISVDDTGNIYIVDQLNNRIMKLSSNGNIINDFSYGTSVGAIDLAAINQELFLLDGSNDIVHEYDFNGQFLRDFSFPNFEQLDRVSGSGAGQLLITGLLKATEVSAQQDLPFTEASVSIDIASDSITDLSINPEVGIGTRRGIFHVKLNKNDNTNGTVEIGNNLEKYTLNVSSSNGWDLGSSNLLDFDQFGNIYILVTSITQSNGGGLQVDSRISKYDNQGNLLSTINLPDSTYTYPNKRLAVDENGDVYQLITEQSGTHLIRWSQNPTGSSMDFNQLSVRINQELLTSGSNTALSCTAQPSSTLQDNVGPFSDVTALSITRDQIISNAEAYRSHTWTVGASNYAARTCTNGCPVGPSHWVIGTQITGVAYQWGGYDAVSDFDTKLSQGYLAGDVSGTSCVGNCATGVDCSGFVSRAWGTSRYTTDTLPQISTLIASSALQKGDILNDIKSHVVLFSYFDGSGNPVYYESAYGAPSKVWLNTTGGWGYVSGYAPYRYNNIDNGSNCPGPSLGNPSDGYVSTSQTVNFSWSAPSGCTFQGYTFRIKDTSNMDSGGTTIIDTGNSETSRTQTIDSQYNNRDLYWGVRTANPLSPNWSVRRFRIEPQSPSCNPNADQVGLYTDANYGGSCVVKDIGNYSNPSAMGIANDSISSVKVGNNVKLTLCQNDNYLGTCEVFTDDDSNLSDNSIGDNQASSAKVESRSAPSCSNGAMYAPLQSGYNSCANEGGTCTFSGQASVAYGANNCYFYQTFTSSVSCSNGIFNDPLVGAGKACYFKIITPPPSANFDAWPQTGIAPLTSTMHIVDTSNISSCSWNYGDGQTGTSCASTHDHIYNNAGTYTVSLSVSGPGGSDSMTRTNYIVASQQQLPDLVPYPRPGAEDPIVISRTTDNSDKDTLISGQTAYIDWGYMNIGQGGAGPHHVKIWIDSTLIIDYPFNSLGAGSLGGFDNWVYSDYVAPGAHTVTMTVDANHDVNESNESNNTWSGTFNWRAPTVQVNSVFTTDNLGPASLETPSKTKANEVHSNAYKDTFNLGDPINLYQDINNDFLTSQDVTADWEVLNPAGRVVPDLSWSGTITIDPGDWWWSLSRTIPTYIPRGKYIFIGSVTYNGNTTTQSQTFTVNGPAAVEVYDAFVEDVNGNIATQGAGPQHSPASDVKIQSGGTFNTGDGIQLYIETYNDVADGESAAFQWAISDPWGREVIPMEWSGNLNSPIGYTWWYLPTTIPSDAISGDYTFTGIITYGDRTTYQSATFHVNGSAGPENDSISAPTIVRSVPYNVQEDTWGATIATDDPTPSCGRGQNSNSVWYRYTPVASGILHVDTQDSNYDTVVAIWTGSAGNLSEVACNDDSNSTTQSWVETSITPSTVYYIEVMSYGAPGGGNLNLNVDFASSISNNDFNTPIVITSLPYSTTQDTRAATQASDDPDLTQCNRLAGMASVWYRYTPATSVTLQLDTEGSDYDTMLAVWSGTRGNLTPVGCNDDVGSVNGNWDMTSILTVSLSAGIPYYIEVSNYNGFIDANGASLTAQEHKPDVTAQFVGGTLNLHVKRIYQAFLPIVLR